MTDLIDRYVLTALRRVPEGQRGDIDRELRASIEDAVDARVDAGAERDAAVDATLRELGDPDLLADRYANRRSQLIGPAVYPAWRKVMLLLLTTVLPVVVVVFAVIQAIEDPDPGRIIGGAIGSILTVGTHMAFWVTAVFALLDRLNLPAPQLRGHAWTPADLPRYESRGSSLPELGFAIVWPVMLILALVLQQFTFSDVPVLNPDNWAFWWPYLIGVLVLEIAYAVWLFRQRVFSHLVTVVNAVLALAFAGPVIWLAVEDRLYNPEFWDFAPQALDYANVAAVVLFVIIAIWDIAEVTIRAEKQRRGLPYRVPGTGL